MTEKKYNVTYEVGKPMTREQMEAFNEWEADQKQRGLPGTGAGLLPDGTAATLDDVVGARRPDDLPPEIPTPGLPPIPDKALFDDEPNGPRRVALVAAVSTLLPQRHASGDTHIKIKAVANGMQDAATIARRMPNDEGVNVYAVELFKFFFMPPLEFEVSDEERDALMECALMAHINEIRVARAEHDKRKEKMLEDMKRQQAASRAVQRGEARPEELDSACVVPEPVVDTDALRAEKAARRARNEVLPSDMVLSHERFAVLTCVDLEPVAEKLVAMEPRMEVRGRVLCKITGAFDEAGEAEAYVQKLKKEDQRYAHHDVAVVNMYEWLVVPPPIEDLKKVVYEDDRLTDLLGSTEKAIPRITEQEVGSPSSASELEER